MTSEGKYDAHWAMQLSPTELIDEMEKYKQDHRVVVVLKGEMWRRDFSNQIRMTEAIDNASASSEALGKAIVWLNIFLVTATVVIALDSDWIKYLWQNLT